MKVVVGLSSLPTSAVRKDCGRDADRELVGVLKLPANGNSFLICDSVGGCQTESFLLLIQNKLLRSSFSKQKGHWWYYKGSGDTGKNTTQPRLFLSL